MGALTIIDQPATDPLAETAEKKFLLGLELRSRVISSASALLKDLRMAPVFSAEKNELVCRFLSEITDAAEQTNTGVDSIFEEIPRFRKVLALPGLNRDLMMSALRQWAKAQYNLNYTMDQIGTWIFKHQNERFLKNPPLTPPPTQQLYTADEVREIKSLNQRILLLEILLKKSHGEAKPPILVVDPTSHCNFRCRHCAQSNHQDHRHTYLSQHSIEKLLPILPMVEQAKLFGTGEATLSPFLPQLIHLTHLNGCNTEVQTNGSTLGRRALNFKEISQLGISFDGGTARTFETLRVGSNFKQLLERIRTLRREYPECALYFAVTVSRINIDEITLITQHAIDLGVRKVYLNKIIPYMDKLLPIALRRSDHELLAAEVLRARTLARAHGIELINCISVAHEIDDNASLDKEALLSYLQQMPVIGIHKTSDIDKLLEHGRRFSFNRYPKELLPLFAQVKALEEPTRDALPVSKSTAEGLLTHLRERVEMLTDELKLMNPSDIVIPYCTSPWVKCFVEAHSGIRPCDPWATDITSLSTAETFQDAWHAPDLVQLRKATVGQAELPRKCQTCTFAEKHLFVDELFEILKQSGIDMEKVTLPEKFNSLEAIRASIALPLPHERNISECLSALKLITDSERSRLPSGDAIAYAEQCLRLASSNIDARSVRAALANQWISQQKPADAFEQLWHYIWLSRGEGVHSDEILDPLRSLFSQSPSYELALLIAHFEGRMPRDLDLHSLRSIFAQAVESVGNSLPEVALSRFSEAVRSMPPTPKFQPLTSSSADVLERLSNTFFPLVEQENRAWKLGCLSIDWNPLDGSCMVNGIRDTRGIIDAFGFVEFGRQLPEQGTMLELGCSSLLTPILTALGLKESARSAQSYYVIDRMLENNLESEQRYLSLLSSLEESGLSSLITPMRMSIARAAGMFPNQSIDIAIINADLPEFSDPNALTTWLPKMKPTGRLFFQSTSPEESFFERIIEWSQITKVSCNLKRGAFLSLWQLELPGIRRR